MSHIQIKNLSKVYNEGQENEVRALDDISFDLEEGTFLVILGPSGAGKSTLLNILGGMDDATVGEYLVNGVDVVKNNAKQMGLFRRHTVGFVFQFYNLMPNLTALENVALAASVAENPLDPVEVIKRVGLEKRANNFPSQLSGGEQQRVSIARALAKNPKLILCDEPTGALDYVTGKEVLSLLSKAAHEENKTVIIVTHNLALTQMADHLIRIKNGQISEDIRNPHPIDIKDIEW